MSSPNSDPSTAPSPPSLEELTTRSAAALILPWMVSLTSGRRAATMNTNVNREVVVFVHQPTRSVTLMEGSSDIDSFLSDLMATKEGPPPASKSSIDALPRVSLSSEHDFECPICLTEQGCGDDDDDVEVKEMPCKHRFHAECIDKWLGVRGTCPVCRFGMPSEEKKVDDRSGWRVHLFFARGRGSESGSVEEVRDTEGGSNRSGSDDELPAEGMMMMVRDD